MGLPEISMETDFDSNPELLKVVFFLVHRDRVDEPRTIRVRCPVRQEFPSEERQRDITDKLSGEKSVTPVEKLLHKLAKTHNGYCFGPVDHGCLKFARHRRLEVKVRDSL